jgi:hypothetical protein
MEVSSQLQALAVFTRLMILRYKRLGGPQRQARCFGEEKNVLEFRFLDPRPGHVRFVVEKVALG